MNSAAQKTKMIRGRATVNTRTTDRHTGNYKAIANKYVFVLSQYFPILLPKSKEINADLET